MTNYEQTILNKKLNGITWGIIFSIIMATATIVGGGNRAYYGLLEAVKDNTRNDAIRDIQISELRIRIEKLEVEIKELKTIKNK